ncbi:hypothetical protein DSO57_1015145 [Entomophthora muscae]|uniref:Uncharacterized protein n=1 Tax=Entomophthora muscae TaxID=34485 RepID=A0ACC2UEW0_9FUNG|nr:hypothetical protein DSO57_1015145 [Entomophthora muscae]
MLPNCAAVPPKFSFGEIAFPDFPIWLFPKGVDRDWPAGMGRQRLAGGRLAHECLVEDGLQVWLARVVGACAVAVGICLMATSVCVLAPGNSLVVAGFCVVAVCQDSPSFSLAARFSTFLQIPSSPLHFLFFWVN